MYYSQLQYDNATDPRWRRLGIEELTDSQVAEIEEIAEEEAICFQSAFELWVKRLNEWDY